MFKKVLIANRGEIACRIIETCQRLGIQSVAVYSEAEAQARYVAMADEAFCIGKAEPKASYLQIETILHVAKHNEVEAIHPGYGFLSENAEFARQCETNNIVFIGPSAEAIEMMGSKSQAKRIMEKAGVPIVPGYHGENQDPQFLQEEAVRIGFPLMIKAVAGGGGKGMRLVKNAEEFDSMLESAKRETLNAFGDEAMLLERFVSTPRHIEFQIFGDHEGNVVHLFERECSIQRRHQKIIEETPSPFLNEALRQSMAAAAVAAAKAIGYVGAGTIEFIVGADGSFYFMEMNTRLQVEHPVTEMTTGIDLVEWQLRVAHQELLPTQQKIHQQGHAFEARIYSENPKNHFFPSTGVLHQWIYPTPDETLRMDTGFVQGDAIQVYYDPMIAKLVVWAETRMDAVQRLQNALAHTGVMGVATNIDFLQAIAEHSQFLEGHIDTLFIDRYLEELIPPDSLPPEIIVWVLGIWRLLVRDTQKMEEIQQSNDSNSPWHQTDCWQLNGQGYEALEFQTNNGNHFSLHIRKHDNGYQILLPEQILLIQVKEFAPPFLTLQYQDKQETWLVLQHENDYLILDGKNRYSLSQIDPLFFEENESIDAIGQIRSPMPGHIQKVLVEPGDEVKKGQPLLILEAMKMEHPLQATHDGLVEAIHYQVGDKVEEKVVLMTLAE